MASTGEYIRGRGFKSSVDTVDGIPISTIAVFHGGQIYVLSISLAQYTIEWAHNVVKNVLSAARFISENGNER